MRRLALCCFVLGLMPAAAVRAADDGTTADKRWAIELGFGARPRDWDKYERRLLDHGFTNESGGQYALDLALVHALHSNLELVGSLLSLESRLYRRHIVEREGQSFSWWARGGALQLRALGRFRQGRLAIYLQGGLGYALARTTFRGALDPSVRPPSDMVTDQQWHSRSLWTYANGVQYAPARWLAFYFQLRQIWAPIVGNLAQEPHESGGRDGQLGLRLSW